MKRARHDEVDMFRGRQQRPGEYHMPIPMTGGPGMPNVQGPPPVHSGQHVSEHYSHPHSYPVSVGGAATQVTVTVQPAPQIPGGYSRLKVEDALSYLDMVKVQFLEQPQVYNQFLDIMKEFKSQSIDTPGVIGRVSALFDGHPDLIRGFNTFLPPGYKVDVVPVGPGHMHPSHPSQQPPVHMQSAPQHPGVHGVPPQPAYHRAPGPPPPPPSSMMQQNDMRAHDMNARAKQPVEFNHAINYVNKIKTRFSQQPEIYKAFLEILHTYQKDQRSIKDVYSQVATLFRSHADLLEEFSQFLPEAAPSGSHPPSGPPVGPPMMGYPPIKQENRMPMNQLRDMEHQYKKPLSNSMPPNIPKPISRAPPLSMPKPKSQMPLPTPTTAITASVAKKVKGLGAKEFTIQEAAKFGTYDEFIFFDKVKRALNSKQAYDNFLRCINLYTIEVLNRMEVVSLVQGFIGRHYELMSWFKNFIGYKEPSSLQESFKPGGMLKETWQEIDYTACKRYGCSYRALPKNYQLPVCSGRSKEDKLLLNDIWVSVPTWSEDSTFVTSRKNIYEESLYKCEDERYELDMVMECNLCLLRSLETLCKKMETMSEKELSALKLPLTLGTMSKVIPAKALERLYGDRYHEVYEALQNNPAVSVPVVLNRLKSKDVEWRKAQRQWNKIWREVHEKNYLKSADHQALTFKGVDKKAMSAKSVVQDIETAFGKEKERLLHEEGAVPAPHAQFFFEDDSIFEDVNEMLLLHVNRTSSNASTTDKDKMEILLKNFLPDFFLYEDGVYPVDLEVISTATDEEGSPSLKSASADAASLEESQKKVKPLSVAQYDTIENPISSKDANIHVFYCNNVWYVFFKLFATLFERVCKIKNLARKIAIKYEKDLEKGVYDQKEPALSLGVKKPPETTPDQYFSLFKNKVKDLIHGSLDSALFEDSLREIFGVQAYSCFTIDKLIQGINRQLQNIISDEKCTRLLSLYVYEKARNQEDEISKSSYRVNAEGIIGGDENCFCVVHSRTDKRVDVTLLDPEDIPAPPDASTVEEKWSSYVDTFVSSNPPQNGVDPKLLGKMFLARTVCARDISEESGEVEFINQLECKICINTYKMFFVENSFDFFYRKGQLRRSLKHHQNLCSLSRLKFHNWLGAHPLSEKISHSNQSVQDWFLQGHAVHKSTRVHANGLSYHTFLSSLSDQAQPLDEGEAARDEDEAQYPDDSSISENLTTSLDTPTSMETM